MTVWWTSIRSLQRGTEVTLDESNTEIFVRSRDTETSQSAIARLGRQKIYIRAFVDKAKELYAEDAGYAAKLYQALTPYMVTNTVRTVWSN